MLLKDLQNKFSSAESVGGVVVAHVDGKHYDLGKLLTEGLVSLSDDGNKLVAAYDAAKVTETQKAVDEVQTALDTANGGQKSPRAKAAVVKAVAAASTTPSDNEFDLK